MIAEYVTKDGHTLGLGRIQRQVIDTFTAKNEPPGPPMRTTETWTGPEQVPDTEAPEYQRALNHYYRELGKLHVSLIAPAVTIPSNVDFGELDELIDADLVSVPGDDNRVGFLLYVLDGDDLSMLVQIIFYNSTVTERGVAEAQDRFGVTWLDKPVTAWHIPGTPGAYGVEFEARRAARHSLISWDDFCAKTGPEQSAVVCFYRMDNRLDYFQTEWRARKTK